MKRIGNVYTKICDIENIKNAIMFSSKGKRQKKCVKRVLEDIDYYALKIRDAFINNAIEFGKDGKMTIKEGSIKKERTITIPRYYPDQIIHWCVMLQLHSVFMKGMYEYSCGSVPKRGGLYAKKYLEKILSQDKKIRYVLKIDIKKFFPSIKKEKLKKLLRTKIKCLKTLSLLDKIIDNSENDGLPIGYYTSQWLSNFYLEKLDHYIKQELKIKYYIRYVDDMILIDTNKRKLHKAKLSIQDFLDINSYGLKIKENWQLFKLNSRPIDFVGYKFYRNYTKLRNHIFYKLNRRVRKIIKRGNPSIEQARSLLSLWGWLSKTNNGKKYYLEKMKPFIKKGVLQKIISEGDKNGKIKKNI